MDILLFAIYSAFCFWVVFMEGAHVLECWKSLFLVDHFAASLTAQELKFYVVISWLGALAIFLFNALGGT